jgi:hypothetical protein
MNDDELVAQRMATTKMTTAKQTGDVHQIYAARWSELVGPSLCTTRQHERNNPMEEVSQN